MTEEITEQEAIRPTPERIAKGGVIVPKTDRTHQAARPARVETQTTLDRYRRRKVVDEPLVEAGERWFSLAYRSGRLPRLCMNLGGHVTGSVSWLHDSQVSAGIQRDQAIAYLAGLSVHFPLVMDYVCVEDGAAEAWAIRQRLKPWHGIKTFKQAAEATARHFGLIK